MIRVHQLAPLVLLMLLTGCTLGPDYQRPELVVPEQFRAAKGWRLAQPQEVAKSAWWEVYGDAKLNALQERLLKANQTLAQSLATYQQAQALVMGSRAAFFPKLTGNAGKTRSAQGGGSGGTVRLPDGSTVNSGGGSDAISNSYSASLGLSWELDLWGRLRRQLEADNASLQASAADLAASRLSLQSELTQNYLQLRITDQQITLLNDTVKAYQRALKLTENQYRAGIATKLEVAQARTQLKSTEAQAIDLRYQRAQLEHAIAVLVGEAPANFQLAVNNQLPKLPEIPVLLPSQLLERRPDVASAERQVMAANAQIGVAKAAWFPQLTLSAAGGYRSGSFQNWIETPNRYWSIGPQFAIPLFDGGFIQSQVDQSEARYDQTVANYRQTVLNSFREVEDYLVQLGVLEEEIGVQQQAVESAQEALRLANNQYKAGTIDYSDVVNIQTSALSNQRTALTLLGNRLVGSVKLIGALGGGWE